MNLDTTDPEYWRALRVVKEAATLQPPPPPEHTSHDPFPEEYRLDGPTIKLRKHAESHGWEVRVGYARGYQLYRRTSYRLVETIGVWMRGHGYRCVAVRLTGSWDSVAVWQDPGNGLPFPYFNFTDLSTFVGMRGKVGDEFFVKARTRVLEARARVSTTKAAPKAKEHGG